VALNRAVSIRDIDFSKLGPNSPLRQLAKRAPRRDVEHQEQVKVFAWAAQNEQTYPDLRWLFAVPNWIGVRTAKHGARLKAEGRKKGVLDIWLPVRRGIHPGFALELKAEGNRATPEQQDWIKHLTREGWRVTVAFSADETIRKLKEYLR
jgi:hypothetical protein